LRRAISTADAPAPAGPYAQACVVGGLVFAAGQGPFNARGERVGTSFEEQVDAVLDNLEHVARAAGSGLEHAVRLGVFICDLADFPTLNDVLERRLSAPLPARTTVPAPLVGFDVEIDAVFALPGSE
jgi:2-iminobutanoate/2-iminopropanoate deaminase